MSKGKVVYYRDESKLHTIPKFMPILMAVEFIAMIVCIIVGVVFLCNKNIEMFLIFGGIALVLYLHGVFCDHYYNWQEHVRYEFEDDKIRYKYDLNECALSSDTTVTIMIVDITKYKLNGKNKITLWGTFKKKTPMRSVIELNKVQLQINLTEREEILGAFNCVLERSKQC